MAQRMMVFLTLMLALSVAAWAQGTGGGGGGTGGGGGQGSGGTGGGGNQGGGNQGGGRGQGQGQQDPFGQQQRNPFEDMRRPIYLSGEVMLANGQPPPEPVTIERVCGGQVTPESYTDSKGRFSFEVGGDPTAALLDASYSGVGPGANQGGFGSMNSGMGRASGELNFIDLTGCDLRASLPGYRSEAVTLGRRRPLDNPDVGTIILHPLEGFQGTIVSATTLTAPKKAKSNFDKAVRELRKGEPNFEKAAKMLEEAVDEHPQFAAAWTWLGETRGRMGDPEGAMTAFEKSIEADPDYIRPYQPLLSMALQQEDWPRVAELADASLKLNPGQTQLQFFKAVAEFNTGKHEQAEQTARRIASGPDAKQFPETHQVIGMIYSQRGMFPQAAAELREYLTLAPNAQSAEQIKKQLFEWEALGVIEKAQQ